MQPANGEDGQKAAKPEKLTFRLRLRRQLDDVRTEFAVTGVVLVYMLLVLIDLVLYDTPECANTNVTLFNSTTNVTTYAIVGPVDDTSCSNTFDYVDLGFLILFDVEIAIRLYAYGIKYLYDWITIIDSTIIVVGTVLSVMVIQCVFTNSLGFLRIVRLIRLVRIFVVMNKVQKARAAYKRTKYLKLGSPVDRVMELLADIKQRLEEQEDKADVAWIMHLIASDKLYSIDLRSAGGGNLDTEMAAWLVGNMGMKKEAGEDAADVDEEGARVSTRVSQGMSGWLGVSASDKSLARQESASISGAASQELMLYDELLERPGLVPHLAKIHSWDVDCFGFHEEAGNAGVVVALSYLLQDYGLVDKFRISKHRLLTFSRRICEGYVAENPYHNAVHALDVLLNTNYFLRQEALQALTTPLDRLAALLAAMIHDFQHPGLNNVFLQATKHELAVTYNDNSVLESHHVASAWKVLMEDDCNFLKGLSREQYLEVRDTVIQLVLGTDMKFHFEHYTKFKTKVTSETFQPGCEREDVKFLLSVAMHTGDIANPAKPQKICLQWTELVMEEFFRQGDLEAKLGMPISPFYDREKTSIAQCQMGFINVLVRPLYEEVTRLLGEPALTECLGALDANLKAWEAQGNDLLQQAKADAPAV